MLPLLPLLLTACAPPPDGFPRGAASDDVDEPAPVALETAGSVGIFAWREPDPAGGVAAGAQFSASFWSVVDPGDPGEGGVTIAPPSDVDACALTLWTAEDAEVVGATPAVRQELLAGAITLSGPSWSAEVLPNANDGATTYYFELDPDHVIDFDSTYSVAAPGGTFPGFDVPDAIALPADLWLLAPASDAWFALDGGDWALAWQGGSEEELWIELANEAPHPTDNVQITCRAANDGAFTIPAALMAQVPEGVELRLTLDQPVSSSFQVNGLTVGVGATASAQALGMR
jgi:hypothetical protein